MSSDTPRRISLNAFDMSCVGHQNPGLWTHPDDQAHRYKELDYWTDLAQLLERGGFDSLFLADVLGTYDVYGESREAAVRQSAQFPVTDPTLVISAMAAVTRNLGFGATVALTYEQPYSFARKMGTLDHLTKGRVAWNIVTSYLQSAAVNLGLDTQISHDDRYEIAEEFLEVCYKLWEGSWEEDAVVRDPVRGVFTDPSKVHDIEHKGEHFSVPGVYLAEPSPQRTPFLFQAGASSRGRTFAARHAEAVFVIGTNPEDLRPTVDDIRKQAAEQGRDPRSVKVIVMLTAVTAPTDAGAQAKLREFEKHASVEGALALYGGWTGVDLAGVSADEPLEYAENDSLLSVGQMFAKIDSSVTWTPQAVARWLGVGGFSAITVGSPTTVVDEMERWVEVADVDGFNVARVITPGTFEDFVELIVPELRRRGRVPAENGSATTLRERIGGAGPRLPEGHPGAAFRR
jgi:FMN-dependent oxidoreductase (nitrilotriacetate monooxygenase family)